MLGFAFVDKQYFYPFLIYPIIIHSIFYQTFKPNVSCRLFLKKRKPYTWWDEIFERILTLKKMVQYESKYLRAIKETVFPYNAIVTDSVNIHLIMSIFLGGSSKKILCFLPLFELFLFFFKMITFLLVLAFDKKLRRTLMTLISFVFP